MIRIRRIDAERVRDLSALLLVADDASSVWELDGTYWAAFDGPRIVGYGGYIKSQRWLDCVYFCDAAVRPEYRGHGLQKRLIRARLAGAKREGFWGSHTYTSVENPASSRSLIRCGFKPYWPKNPWAGDMCYWWRKL
jgi:GNAT superfamily N-acetyltransferase